MKMRYNLALIPITQRDRITQLSQQLSTIANNYLLGKNSLPHVTLCQFLAEQSDLPLIWEEINDSVKSTSIPLVFKQVSCLMIHDFFWVSLLPDSSDALLQMHYSVATIIKTPLNQSFEHYDPHMTLINTKEKSYVRIVNQLLGPPIFIADTFTLSLGKSDDIGQLTEVIYR
jgi:2'-5' RNA ligase